MSELHASVLQDINAGEIVDHSEVAGIVFSDDGKHCLCADCIDVELLTADEIDAHQGEIPIAYVL